MKQVLAPIRAPLWTALLLAACASGPPPAPPEPPPPPPPQVPLLEGFGTHTHAISTREPLAQQYFDQGLRLAYAFSHEQAQRSFEEAARLDPQAPMPYWGIAYVLGPNYNVPADGEKERQAHAAIQKGLELVDNATPAEADYVRALAKRYADPLPDDRKPLDHAYADAMRALSQKYPDDVDAATLFAESMMDLQPWDLWTRDGRTREGTEEIVIVLESVLQRQPDHPGANHFFIHAIEASPRPGQALASAERLKTLAPASGHLLHMPAHVYLRTGGYGAAADAASRAAEVERANLLERGGDAGTRDLAHALHFQAAAAAMAGRSKDAFKAARDLAQAVPLATDRSGREYMAPTLYFVHARFGRWSEVLKEPAPPEDLPFARGAWHFARGLARLGRGDVPAAEREAADLERLGQTVSPERKENLNPTRALLEIAHKTLMGEIAGRKGDRRRAVTLLRGAAQIEDSLAYDAPSPWFYPVRHHLGAVFAEAGRHWDAIAVYKDDLKRNPENGWSLFGLAQALHGAGQHGEAAKVDERFRKAWAGADTPLTASRF